MVLSQDELDMFRLCLMGYHITGKLGVNGSTGYSLLFYQRAKGLSRLNGARSLRTCVPGLHLATLLTWVKAGRGQDGLP